MGGRGDGRERGREVERGEEEIHSLMFVHSQYYRSVCTCSVSGFLRVKLKQVMC